ncbi:hypothetical protein [Actinoplanes philippinensis]|uniref:hypothetical protein n=1 Tax=Actinoplanes philippinensis TaxID=35752 RepID=UPI0033CE7092
MLGDGDTDPLGPVDGVAESLVDGPGDGLSDADGEDETGGEEGGGGAGGTGRPVSLTWVATGDGRTATGEALDVSGVYEYVLSGSSSSGSSPAPAPPKSMSAPGNCSSTGAGR